MFRTVLATAFAVLAMPALAVELGDDGLHKTDWMRDTFKDLAEDYAEAQALGLDLMVLIEQRGCIYCTRMHEEVFPVPEIDALIRESFFVVQINMFGSVEVTDFDGESLSERDMVAKWGVLFTPTILFFDTETPIPEGATAARAAVATMPGAFEQLTTRHLLEWVRDSGFEGEEVFQKYHARRLEEEGLL